MKYCSGSGGVGNMALREWDGGIEYGSKGGCVSNMALRVWCGVYGI